MGNQMFQYALARRRAEDLKAPFKLDITGFENQPSIETKRDYQLHHFNIIENFATPEEIRKIKYPWGFFSKLKKAVMGKILRHQHIGYEAEILKKKGDVYLDGYWHNEKYFQSIRSILEWEFSLKEPLSEAGERAAAEIKAAGASGKSAVSLHVRRGDYASDPATHKYHGLMTTEYYGGAIEIIKSRVGDIKVFVFSDEIEWVKEHIPLKDEHYFVTNPKIPFYEEVYLMSLCEHNIIANSSFSWWAAWLNQNPNKIVVAPKKWLAKTGNDYYHEIPDSWIKI